MNLPVLEQAIDLGAGADLEFPSRGVIFLTTFK